MFDVPPGAGWDRVPKAAESHIVGKGELVGAYAQEVNRRNKWCGAGDESRRFSFAGCSAGPLKTLC